MEIQFEQAVRYICTGKLKKPSDNTGRAEISKAGLFIQGNVI